MKLNLLTGISLALLQSSLVIGMQQDPKAAHQKALREMEALGLFRVPTREEAVNAIVKYHADARDAALAALEKEARQSAQAARAASSSQSAAPVVTGSDIHQNDFRVDFEKLTEEQQQKQYEKERQRVREAYGFLGLAIQLQNNPSMYFAENSTIEYKLIKRARKVLNDLSLSTEEQQPEPLLKKLRTDLSTIND